MRKVLDKIMEWACILLFSLMTLVGTFQIVTRYVFDSPSTISEELLTYLFTWLALIAAAYVFGKRDHMRMSFLVERFSPKIQLWLQILSECMVMLLAIFVLGFGGIHITRLTMTQQSASLGIPMSYVYCIVPISGAVIVIYNLLNLKLLCKDRNEGREE